MLRQKLVRVQEKGQVTIPTEVRRRLGIKQGDLVEMIETSDGVLISPRKVVATRALDRIGEALRETGLSLEELIESGREERVKLIEERHAAGPASKDA
jgi:AbrB family looped-hinge helix DNA binding protein